MILLSGHSLTQDRKVPLEALSLNLTERDSSANMTPADMTGIGIDSWFQDDTNPGAGIVWRVKSISQAFATDTPTIELEHVINTLRDNVIFGEITAATITGNQNATSVSAEQAVRYILSYQSDWVLGEFGYSVSNPYKFDGESLYDALETVSDSLSNAWWSYDTTVYPFRLNITAKATDTETEMRAGRNLITITKTIDKSQMITRFYPIGKDDIRLPGGYVEKNANLYGVVSKVETDTSIDSIDELSRWAWERLAGHCEPTVTVEVEGLELADATGESLDRMQLGRYCRIPLEEFSTEITERIITVNYPDKVHQPEMVKLTLANSITDIVKIVADAIKNGTGGGGGRAAAKQQKVDHAWFEDTETHVGMVARAVGGVGYDGEPDWDRISSIYVDGEGIHQMVQETQHGLTVAYTQIDLNEKRILLEAQRATSAEGQLSGRITVEADRITQEVSNRISADTYLSSRITVEAGRITQEVNNRISSEAQLSSRIVQTANQITAEVTARTSADNELSSRITVNAQGIETKVSKNGVISSINQSAEEVSINASKINLTGYVTASDLASTNASIENLKTGVTRASYLKTEQFNISDNYFTLDGTNARWRSYSARWCSLGGEHTFNDTGGTSYTGRLVTGYTDTTIYYLGHT